MVSCSSQVTSSEEARYVGLLDDVGAHVQQSYFYLCRAARSLGRVYRLEGMLGWACSEFKPRAYSSFCDCV